MSKFLYAEQVFNADNNEKAQLISLPPAAGLDSRGRALKESMPTLDLLNRCIEIKPGDLIIDFGCGYGRLSKLLIERFGAFVISCMNQELMVFPSTAFFEGGKNGAFSVIH